MITAPLQLKATKHRKPGFWIPYAIIGFFVMLIIVQICFLILATRSFSGLVTDEPYATGIDYNDIIAARKAEAELGWAVSLYYDQGRVIIEAKDANGIPLDATKLHGTAELMGRAPQLIPLTFEPQRAGLWSASLNVPVPGRWYARVHVESSGHTMARLIEFEARPK